MKYLNKSVNYLLLGLLILVNTLTSCKKSEQKFINEYRPEVGYLAPEFSLSDKEGKTIKRSDFSGKVLLIEFWASWCGYCNEEIPELNSIYDDFKSQNFEIVGISIDKDQQAWLDKVNSKGIEYIQVNDTDAFSAEVVNDYNVEYIPRMFLVNEAGYIIEITNSANDIRATLNQVLN